jgi:putative OPT family oligopeptide transporter
MPTESKPDFQPYVSPQASMRELTVRSVIVGAILGVIFGASSLYLVLKVGLTVSASIPVAVISLSLFRAFSKVFGIRDATILENNIVQTAGSAGESIAFGLGVTMPAIMILGFDLEIGRVMLVGLLGGLLGILLMIPLRRALIVAQHGTLKYPEGTACAEVLKAGAQTAETDDEDLEGQKKGAISRPATELDASAIFTGLGIGLAYNTLMRALRLWKDTPEKVFGAPFKAGSIAIEITPELLGVGYIIGPRIASLMMAGGVLSYLVLIPMIKFFGENLIKPLAPSAKLISTMSPSQIRQDYILYIGAGAVAAGGIISLIRSMPVIWHGIRAGLSDFAAAASTHASVLRTERDISMKYVAAGILALVIAIFVSPTLHMNFLGALLIVLFGFIFVAVSSRLTGEIGSSSNPISGMTIATLLLTCLVFYALRWTDRAYYVTALSVGGIVCVAASNGGSTSQDLKTGFLIGATPKFQQIAILVGAAASALVLGWILLILNDKGTVYVPASEVAPGLHAPAGTVFSGTEKLRGPQAADDPRTFHVWQKIDPETGTADRFLVDDSGAAVWLVDPGINGNHKTRPDKTEVRKYEAPKAVLMSYIIKGILDKKLPWGLVLFGAMTSIVLELCGASSLAFAVGVYLPISSSAPLFVGGLVRWLVDRRIRRRLREHNLSEDELVAEGDKSPGVLLGSGYIAGGAIAGIIIAFIQGGLGKVDAKITNWAEHHNWFYQGPNADWLALLPFAALVAYLYIVGKREGKKRAQPS